MSESTLPETSVVVIGHGQQGKRTIEKLAQLRDSGHRIRLLAVIDPNQKNLEAESAKGKRINDLFPEAQLVPEQGRHVLSRFRPTVVIDCANTVSHGSGDVHMDNLFAALDNPNLRAYGVEKPAGMNHERLLKALRQAQNVDVAVIPHAVESLTRTKRAVRDDIKRRGIPVKSIICFRLSAVQKSSVDSKRLILTGYGGALRDKSPHDLMESILTVQAGSEEKDPSLFELAIYLAKFSMLEIVTPGGRSCRVRKNEGTIEENVPVLEASESHAAASFDLNGAALTIVASHLGATAQELGEMDSWFTPALREAVAEAAAKHGQLRKPETIVPYFGTNGVDLQARVSTIECSDGTRYVTQTFAKDGGPFAARIHTDGSVTVLDYSPKPYDGHLEWVRNLILVASTGAEPAVATTAVALEGRILEGIEAAADRSQSETLDLSEANTGQNPLLAELAKLLEPQFRAAREAAMIPSSPTP